MRRYPLIAPLMALLLLIPAATAYGADQEVYVQVLPPDTLAISVEQSANFGGVELGQARHYDFWMGVTNTTADGFNVTVSGNDLESFEWEGCDESGCWNPIPTGTTIPSTSLVVNGGDLDWWDVDAGYDVVVPASVSVTPAAQTIVTAGAAAHGEFGFDNPMASLDLTIPMDATAMLQYRTVLTYTINGPTP